MSIIVISSIALGLMLMVYQLLGPFRAFFWNIPYIAGFLGSQHYLVLLQNNNELRPTGGFITAVAEVDMLFGVPSISVTDSYQVPNPPERLPAPEPFQYFIGQNDPFFAGLTFRDANFSPDFPTSAEEIIRVYQLAYPDRDVDGVFTLDFAVLESLLDLYGPLEIEDVTFTKDNFFLKSQRISKDIDTHNEAALESRKNVLKPFTKTLVNEIIGSPTKWHRLMTTLDELIQEKHVQLYSSSEGLQEKFLREGLSTELRYDNPESDFLHVNVANIGGRKADRYVTKEIKYTADFSNPAGEQSILSIDLNHMGSYNIQSDIYQAYIRVYLPAEAKVIRSSGSSLRSTVKMEDETFQILGDYIRMKPGDSLRLEYRYELPETIHAENYQLQIVKQPGIQSQYWQVAVKQQNDSGMQNLYLNPKVTEMSIRENLALWRGELVTDRFFHVLKNIDLEAPLILWQKFEDLETINVRFQEALDPISASEIANYQIIDKNVNNPTDDSVQVLSARFDGRDLWLKVSGVTLQDEEHYQLIMRDIQDVHANMIQPNPLERTLVQRLSEEFL